MAMSRSLGLDAVMSRSPMWMLPEVTVSSPAIMFSSVDLPQPDGPTRIRNSSGLDLDVDALQNIDRTEALADIAYC